MTEMFGEAWSPMSVPDLAPDDDDDLFYHYKLLRATIDCISTVTVSATTIVFVGLVDSSIIITTRSTDQD